MKPIAILTADWHLRADVPVCRTDDYYSNQIKKLSKIQLYAMQNHIPILHAGDIFHKARANRVVEHDIIIMFKELLFIGIPGNHDLLGHSFSNFDNSSIGVFSASLDFDNSHSIITCIENNINGFKYSYSIEWRNKKIAILHEYVHNPTNVNPNIPGIMPKKIFDQLLGYDLILTGDNHQTFIVQNTRQLLVNPGSLMRMTADQIDHKPCFFVYYEDNTVEPVYFDIEEGVIDRSHIEIQNEKDKRIEAFVNRMNENYEISLSFEKNLENYFKANKIRESVKNIAMEALV